MGKLGISRVCPKEQGFSMTTNAETVDSPKQNKKIVMLLLWKEGRRVCATCVTEGSGVMRRRWRFQS